MVALWLPILLSAVFVFLASSISHMVLKLHRADFEKLPDEDAVLEAMRKAGVGPGNYAAPYCKEQKDMGSPEMMEKYDKGPVGFFYIIPNGAPAMGKYLSQWFVYLLVVGIFVAYVTSRTLGPGADYLEVFRVSGTAAFLAYSVGEPAASIWGGRKWGTTFRHMLDGLIYALLTGGTFGWLWPS